jgi:hypothetical protein
MAFFSLPQLNKKSEQNTIPTKIGVSLTLPQWKVLCSATQVVDNLISRVKDGEPVDWRYDLGEDVYIIIKALQLTILFYCSLLVQVLFLSLFHLIFSSHFIVYCPQFWLSVFK